jgi:hypothetical protein
MSDSLTTQTQQPSTIPNNTKIATDDAGEAGHVQIVKMAQSADGIATPIQADSNGLLIAVSNFTELVETRTTTPTLTKAINVQIGPGDPISKIPVFITYDHHQLHEGEEFRWSVYVASLGNGSSKDIRLVVPDITITTNAVTQCPHLRFEFVASLGGDAYLYEAPTVTGNGTSRTPIPMERNGTYTPLLQIFEDPTVSVVGTQLWRGLLLSSKASAGNASDSSTEFVLKNNTSYLLRFTSGAPNNVVLIRMVWYEDKGV